MYTATLLKINTGSVFWEMAPSLWQATKALFIQMLSLGIKTKFWKRFYYWKSFLKIKIYEMGLRVVERPKKIYEMVSCDCG